MHTSTTLVCFALLCTLHVFAAEESSVQKAVATEITTEASVTTATPKPKIDIIASIICKKCNCDKANKKLDCSKKNLTTWFSSEEWDMLQNGDLIFDTLRLDHNKLTQVPQLPTYAVKNLYLGFNEITDLAIGAFQNLTELAKLDLSHNKINSKALKPDVFRGRYSPSDYLPLDNLRELDLGYNDLHTLDPDLFEHTQKLETLILCKNTFHVIDLLTETAISGLTSLKTLDLSYMEINELPDNLLHGPRDLKTLILSGNLLDELPDKIELSINLRQLVLDENPIGDFVGEKIFPALISLEYLSMSYMPELKTIGKGAFKNLQNLTTLIATDNMNLSYIDSEAFARETSNPEIFDYPPLQKLILHNNNLNVLPHGMIERWDKLNTIDLRFNPWVCNCSNHWLIHTLMTQINTTTPMFANNVECATPEDWKNVPLIDVNSNKKTLVCDTKQGLSDRSNLLWLGVIIGIVLAIPMTIGTVIIYRRGCFGWLNIGNSNTSSLLYNRASFNDEQSDFHI